ncbi:protein FAM32A isoform X1 [Petromyzon marinus]|uniref:Protein FAM32A n=1 Tax=Petromyzon marinus TaxID=7757 RepID=A0AAJ7WL86_PETMA|nr:protein FAM32A [Petromyzon marinus]
MADYESVQKGSLKLKGVKDLGVKKKRKRSGDARKVMETGVSSAQGGRDNEDERETPRGQVDTRTPAQKAFDKMQEKRQMERVLQKASKTHKQRVEEFNRHLDTLTEHYDIPKVSWTK